MDSLADDTAHEAALDFLLERIDYERTSAVAYDKRDFRLDRMRELLAALGDPQSKLKIIHIAGTKGKGSTAAMIAAMLTAAGRSAGLYSSPHLKRVEERIAVDARDCDPADFVLLIRRVQPAVAALDARGEITGDPTWRPTYFEIITALALMHFADRNVDAAVLEVGLGGRLDSTNVCTPIVSVITSISFDHTKQLGNTLAAIAAEKAGIIKQGVPVVSGVVDPQPRRVIRSVAVEHGCRLLERGVNFEVSYRAPRHLETASEQGRIDFQLEADGQSLRLDDVALGLLGEHQAANAGVALATIAELRRQGWDLPEAALRRGLAEVRWPARVEVVGRRPTVILDAAHNVASVEALVRVIRESFQAPRKLLVFATTQDKDVRGMLAKLLPAFDKVFFTRYLNNPRGVPPEELAMMAADFGDVPHEIHQTPADAWLHARSSAAAEDLVVITGSFFIAAEISAAIRATAADADNPAPSPSGRGLG